MSQETSKLSSSSEKWITMNVITRLESTGQEGHYVTKSSQIFAGQNWREGVAIGSIAEVPPDVPLDAVIVPVRCTATEYGAVRDIQNGNNFAHEPNTVAIYESSATWEATGEAVDESANVE